MGAHQEPALQVVARDELQVRHQLPVGVDVRGAEVDEDVDDEVDVDPEVYPPARREGRDVDLEGDTEESHGAVQHLRAVRHRIAYAPGRRAAPARRR
eukprot:SAG11_NODE_1175_length_5601_cov_15.947110_4_plen_97_part_00